MTPIRHDINSWIDSIATLHTTTAAGDRSAERQAYEAVGNLWSQFGWQDAPADVLRLLVMAVETGYVAALRDLDAGHLDDEIRSRRDLADLSATWPGADSVVRP